MFWPNNYDYSYKTNSLTNNIFDPLLALLVIVLVIEIIVIVIKVMLYIYIKRTASNTKSLHNDFITLANALNDQNNEIISQLDNISNKLDSLTSNDSKNNNTNEH